MPRKPPKIVEGEIKTQRDPAIDNPLKGYPNQQPIKPDVAFRSANVVQNIIRLPRLDMTCLPAVQERTELYFEICANNGIKPGIAGWAAALGINRVTLLSTVRGSTRYPEDVLIYLQNTYNTFDALWESYMINGGINVVAGIFLGKNNYGYVDKQEHVVSPGNQDFITEESITAKYNDIPDDEI